MGSVLEELTKNPTESFIMNMDFTALLEDNENLAGITSVSFTNSNTVIDSSNITLGDYTYLGKIAQVRISDGTLYEQYAVTFTTTTTLGNTRTGTGLLRII